MGSIGELAHDLLHKPAAGISMAKRTSVIEDMEDEDQLRRREREERTMSFGSGISSLSSAMSLDDEEAGESSPSGNDDLGEQMLMVSSYVCCSGRISATAPTEAD